MPIIQREMKWVVRLHKAIDNIDNLKATAREVAMTELVGEILGVEMLGHPVRPINLIEAITGKKFSEKERGRIWLVKIP